MRANLWTKIYLLVVGAFFLGFLVSYLAGLVEKGDGNEPVDTVMASDATLVIQAESQQLFVNEGCRVTKVTRRGNSEDDFAYYAAVYLAQIDSDIILDISEIEYKILEEGDEVKVHYVYSEPDHALLYCEFLRDELGRLDISIGEPILVIDPGHGGYDDGLGSNNLWLEKEINLKMSLKLKAYLEAAGIRVVLTRSEEEYLSLFDRCAISNYIEADLFISNHVNSFNGDVNGVQVIYSLQSDEELANRFAQAIALSGSEINKVYTKTNDYFPSVDYYSVHRNVDAESYILEYGYADNDEDAAIIDEHWEEMCENVGDIIIDYMIK